MKLSEHPFMLSVSDGRRKGILAEIEILHLQEGDAIFNENDPSDALFLTLEGSVRFTKQNPDGTIQHVSDTGAGTFFGEVGVFTGERRSMDARAYTKCVIGRASEKTIQEIFEDANPVKQVLESVIHHLKKTTEHYMDEMMRTEKLTLVGTMISSLLHDFKNPYSIISLGAHLINQRHGDDPKTAKICANIEAQIRRMVDMANDLAAFSRGEGEIEIGYVSLERLFEYFCELNPPFFNDKTVTVALDSNGVSFQGDASKLLRVLQNLITNAIEAIHQTEQRGYIKVMAAEDETHAILRVSDNGPGIPETIQPNFFAPFITYGKSEGTGLGSAIVKSIIDAHRGSIDFETGKEGTTFTIKLPKKGKNRTRPAALG
jgi:signal transduction histidine kinase